MLSLSALRSGKLTSTSPCVLSGGRALRSVSEGLPPVVFSADRPDVVGPARCWLLVLMGFVLSFTAVEEEQPMSLLVSSTFPCALLFL